MFSWPTGEAALVETCGVKHTSSRPSCLPSCPVDDTNCPRPRLSNDRDKSCFIVRRRVDGTSEEESKEKDDEDKGSWCWIDLITATFCQIVACGRSLFCKSATSTASSTRTNYKQTTNWHQLWLFFLKGTPGIHKFKMNDAFACMNSIGWITGRSNIQRDSMLMID